MRLRLAGFLRRLRHARSGVAAIEFAMVLPFLMVAGIYGTELTWYMLVNMRVSQVALQVADNASRIGDTSTITDRKIYESDLNDVLLGANLDGGNMLKLLTNGRVIVSSLEVNPSNQQYIHWQRCKGLKSASSSYGVAGDIKASGIGPAGQQVTAEANDGVIFVEIIYTYQPLISGGFISNKTIKAIASFTVRDDRDLSQIYQTNPASTVASCSTFSAT